MGSREYQKAVNDSLPSLWCESLGWFTVVFAVGAIMLFVVLSSLGLELPLFYSVVIGYFLVCLYVVGYLSLSEGHDYSFSVYKYPCKGCGERLFLVHDKQTFELEYCLSCYVKNKE